MAQPRVGAPDGAQFLARLPGTRRALLLALPVVLLATVAMARAATVGPPTLLGLTVGAEEATPEQLTATAANVLEAATAKAGAGYAFEIVQTSTMVQRPNGPPIAIEPAAGAGEPALVVEHLLATYLESGFVTPDGYFAEIRRGPDDPATKPDFTSGPIELAALVRDGRMWRNDGTGWYETTDPPGLGLDPRTAALLPTLLRTVSSATDAALPPPREGPPAARALAADTTVAAVPGIIAVDLAAATEITRPATFAFDEAGRLVGLTIVARNTNMVTWDLLVETTMAFTYLAGRPALPKPEPAWVAPPPDPDIEAEERVAGEAGS